MGEKWLNVPDAQLYLCSQAPPFTDTVNPWGEPPLGAGGAQAFLANQPHPCPAVCSLVTTGSPGYSTDRCPPQGTHCSYLLPRPQSKGGFPDYCFRASHKLPACYLTYSFFKIIHKLNSCVWTVLCLPPGKVLPKSLCTCHSFKLYTQNPQPTSASRRPALRQVLVSRARP